jgi:hypothetical protein
LSFLQADCHPDLERVFPSYRWHIKGIIPRKSCNNRIAYVNSFPSAFQRIPAVPTIDKRQRDCCIYRSTVVVDKFGYRWAGVNGFGRKFSAIESNAEKKIAIRQE